MKDLDVDVKTRQGVARRITGINYLNLDDKEDLKCYILNEIPEHVKHDVREFMGGDPTDSDVEDFMVVTEERYQGMYGISHFNTGWYDDVYDDEDDDDGTW